MVPKAIVWSPLDSLAGMWSVSSQHSVPGAFASPGGGRGESDKQQEFWEKCRSEVTPPVRGATQVHMSYTWNGLRSSSWKPSEGVKSHRGVTLCKTRRHPASLLLTRPFVTWCHLSPLAWPTDVTRVQPRAASTATEGAMWWSGTVKIGVTLTAECSSRCARLEVSWV